MSTGTRPPIPRFSGLWSSTSTFQFLVVEDQVLVFKVFPLDSVQTASPSKKRISERIVEHFVDPVSSGGLLGSSSSRSPTGVDERTDEPGEGVFRTFHQNKKSAKLGSHSWSELLPESSPSTRAAQLEDSVEWVRLRERHAGKTNYWNRRTNSTAWKPPPGVKVVWVGEKDEVGGVWYWHWDTRASTYELPPLPPG